MHNHWMHSPEETWCILTLCSTSCSTRGLSAAVFIFPSKGKETSPERWDMVWPGILLCGLHSPGCYKCKHGWCSGIHLQSSGPNASLALFLYLHATPASLDQEQRANQKHRLASTGLHRINMKTSQKSSLKIKPNNTTVFKHSLPLTICLFIHANRNQYQF